MAANPPSQAAFTVKTNGQTLIVCAGRTLTTMTAELFSDAANASSVTTPATIPYAYVS